MIRTDFLVGLFILITIGIVVGVMVRTSGLLEGQYRLYMRSATADGLSPDTRVYLQGLAVGRVRDVRPVLNSATQQLNFVVTLSLSDEFPGGAALRLPVGTRAAVTQPNPFVGGNVIELQMPDSAVHTLLEPGDTIESQRLEGVTDLLAGVADGLREEIATSLAQTRELIARTSRTVEASNRMLETMGPKVEATLDRLSGTLERTDSVLLSVGPQFTTMADTLLTTLAETRLVLARFDTLAQTAHFIASENRMAVTETLARLQRSAIVFEHFANRVSRRPLRLLTGVEPPQPDSTERRP